MWEHIHIVLLAGGMVATSVGTIVGTTWKVSEYFKKHDTKLSSLENAWADGLHKHQMSDVEEFNKVRKEIDQEGDIIRHEVGEAIHAIREVIRDLQLSHEQAKSNNMEMYVRKASFYEVTERIQKEWKDTTKDLVSDIKMLTKEITTLNATIVKNNGSTKY